jgi:hypothetical protein
MNITLSVDERSLEEARRIAAARGTSVNQLVREYIDSLARLDGKAAAEEFRRLSASGSGNSDGRPWKREDAYDRASVRR